MLCATLFVFPFRHAAWGGRGAGAALGLLFFVALIFSPWAALRWPRMSGEKKRLTFSLSWKMALAAAAGNIAQGYAFEDLHAGVASTFIQMNVLFVAVIAFIWLREVPSRATSLGVALAVCGVAITQWPALTGHFEWKAGVFWAVLAAFGFSWIDILSRKDSQRVDAVVTNVARAWLATILLMLVPGALDQVLAMNASQVGACALAALLGPGIARLLLISASKELPAAESALLQQLRPPLAIPLVSIVVGVWPTEWEWWGSALVTAGVVLPLAWKMTRPQPQSLSVSSREHSGVEVRSGAP